MNKTIRIATGLGLLVLAVGTSTTAFAQKNLTFGGDARRFAMGGVGIALQTTDEDGVRMNPASLAFEKPGFGYRFPSVAVRSNNDVATNRVYNYFVSGKLSNVGNINQLAKEFASDDSAFGLNANAQLRFGPFEIGGYAAAKGKILPNDILKAYVKSGLGGSVPAGSQADVIAAGYYNLPSIGFGMKVPQSPKSRQDYAVGLRVNIARGYYSHFIANSAVLNSANNIDSARAPELGSKNYLQKSGVGADLGFMMSPKSKNGSLTAGLVVANALKPNIKFDGTDRNGAPTKIDFLKTTASAGTAYQTKLFTAAADIVDITRSAGPTDLRLGGEVRLPFKIAVRGGYNSGQGFTCGLGIFGFNVAYSKRQPIELVRTLNF